MNKKKIDLTEKKDIQQVSNLANFLYTYLDIKSGLKLTDECEDLLEEWCDECDYHKEDCECRDEGYGRYMREYDDGADYED